VSNANKPSPDNLSQLEPFDDPEPGSTWFLSLAGVVILIALVVAISALNFNTERNEFTVKVIDAAAGASSLAPTKPVDAEAFAQIERTLAERAAEGGMSRAEFTKLSQGLRLNAWMRYPWEDTKGQTQQLIRIPITEAMKLVADEYAAKASPRAHAEPLGAAAGIDGRDLMETSTTSAMTKAESKESSTP